MELQLRPAEADGGAQVYEANLRLSDYLDVRVVNIVRPLAPRVHVGALVRFAALGEWSRLRWAARTRCARARPRRSRAGVAWRRAARSTAARATRRTR